MTKETSKNIHQRLHAVMKNIDYVQKEDKKVNNQYKFVSHDAVTKVCRKAFVENDVLTIPSILKRTVDGNKTTLRIEVKFINIDNPDDFISTISYGEGIDTQDKGIGKAYSYAVKYAYLKALGLETGDDPERDNIEHEPENKNDIITEKALGGSIASSLHPDEQDRMYNQAIVKLGECVTIEKLEEVYASYKKTKKAFTSTQFNDIIVKTNECKEELENEKQELQKR